MAANVTVPDLEAGGPRFGRDDPSRREPRAGETRGRA